jgi:signal transduction histidine kinase
MAAEPTAASTPTVVAFAARAVAGSGFGPESIAAILQEVVVATRADSGAVYLLDLRTSSFTPAATAGAATWSPVPVDDARVRTREGSLGSFLDSVEPDAQGIVVYLNRSHACVGALCLRGSDALALTDEMRPDLGVVADLLAAGHRERAATAALSAIEAPIDFATSEGEFLDGLMLLVASATQVEFVVLREIEKNELRTVALFGVDEPAGTRGAWDLSPASDYPGFADALAGTTLTITDRDRRFDGLREARFAIRSSVLLPCRVGTETIGVLSLGTRCRYAFSEAELRAFEVVAGAVGVAITNHRNSQQLALQVSKFTEASLAITAMEISRAARHEAIGRLDTCMLALRNLHRRLRPATPEIDGAVDRLAKDIQSLRDAMDRLRSPGIVQRDRDPQPLLLRDIFGEAQVALVGRLQQLRVEVQWEGPNIEVDGHQDLLRHAFLNLLINSLDAFGELRKKQHRTVNIRVDLRHLHQRQVILVYRDNATGIQTQKLHVPAEFADAGVAQQIFMPGVTSKPFGSGYGLWLARRIIDQHHGSIELVDYRGRASDGTAFRIVLPVSRRTNVGGLRSTMLGVEA